MKLPNFHNDKKLNSLKKLMGLNEDDYGTFDASKLNQFELKAISTPEGIPVSLGDIDFSKDNISKYKGRHVLIYMRDWSSSREPKFHISNCSTLQGFSNKNQSDKYVATNDISGNFIVNYTDGRGRKEKERLFVCQNCLRELNYNNFLSLNNAAEKIQAVNSFNLSDFFGRYSTSFTNNYKSAKTAPINDYPENWSEISRRVRANAGWTCQKCSIYLGEQNTKKWLSVHHVNRMKNDNRLSNLMVLCLRCHAQQSDHEHLKNTADYLSFMQYINSS